MRFPEIDVISVDCETPVRKRDRKAHEKKELVAPKKERKKRQTKISYKKIPSPMSTNAQTPSKKKANFL